MLLFIDKETTGTESLKLFFQNVAIFVNVVWLSPSTSHVLDTSGITQYFDHTSQVVFHS